MITLRLLPALFFLSCAAPFAHADLSVYKYVGNAFTSQYGLWPANPTRITATITLAQAIPGNSSVAFNAAYLGPDLLGWTVSDGVRTLTGSDTGLINLYTDAKGSISNWTIAVGERPYAGSSYAFAMNTWGPGTPCDGAAYYAPPSSDRGCPTDFTANTLFLDPNPTIPFNVFAGVGDPGVWTMTPEPTGIGMLLAGTMTLLAIRLSRKSHKTE